jgi:hypothetical protein
MIHASMEVLMSQRRADSSNARVCSAEARSSRVNLHVDLDDAFQGHSELFDLRQQRRPSAPCIFAKPVLFEVGRAAGPFDSGGLPAPVKIKFT